MFVTEYKRTAFERQIGEAVKIREAAQTSNILNSRSEWNQSSLPSLVMKISNREQALKEIEKEIREEKIMEEKIESKIRDLRKKRNKERLITEKNTTRKRQKVTEDKYISIRDKWGPPTHSAPKKNQRNEIPEETTRKKMRVEPIELNNLRRIPDRVVEGETITEFEIETIDWEKHLEEHRKG